MPLKKTTAPQVKDDFNTYIKDDIGLKMIMEEVLASGRHLKKKKFNLEHVR